MPTTEGDFWTEGESITPKVYKTDKEKLNLIYKKTRDIEFHKTMDQYYKKMFEKIGFKY